MLVHHCKPHDTYHTHLLKALSDSWHTKTLHIICCQWLSVSILQCSHRKLHCQCKIMVFITENSTTTRTKGPCWTHVEHMPTTWIWCFVQWNQNNKCWPHSCLHTQTHHTCDIMSTWHTHTHCCMPLKFYLLRQNYSHCQRTQCQNLRWIHHVLSHTPPPGPCTSHSVPPLWPVCWSLCSPHVACTVELAKKEDGEQYNKK